MLLINKNNFFCEEMIEKFEFIEYENYNEDIFLVEAETFKHFEMLSAHLSIEDIIIDIAGAYRSLERQENIFLEFMQKYGLDYAEQIVAMPGTSEHHTGLAIDLIIKVNGKWIIENDELLEQKEIFSKIHKVLKHFGFILRYPEGKEEITGYPYEPWHIRYVGVEEAKKIDDITLEEYLNKY